MSSNIHIQVPERVTCGNAWSRPDCEKDATYILVSIFGVPVGAVCDEHFRTYYRDNLRAIPLRVVTADVAPTSGICKACGKEYTTNCCDECWSKAEPVPNPDAPVASAERCANCSHTEREHDGMYGCDGGMDVELRTVCGCGRYVAQPTDTTEHNTSEGALTEQDREDLVRVMQQNKRTEHDTRPCLCDECNGVQHDTARDERVTALLEMVRDLARHVAAVRPQHGVMHYGNDDALFVRDRADAMLRARDGGGK